MSWTAATPQVHCKKSSRNLRSGKPLLIMDASCDGTLTPQRQALFLRQGEKSLRFVHFRCAFRSQLPQLFTKLARRRRKFDEALLPKVPTFFAKAMPPTPQRPSPCWISPLMTGWIVSIPRIYLCPCDCNPCHYCRNA